MSRPSKCLSDQRLAALDYAASTFTEWDEDRTDHLFACYARACNSGLKAPADRVLARRKMSITTDDQGFSWLDHPDGDKERWLT